MKSKLIENTPVETAGARDLALVGVGYWGKNLARNFRELGALHTLCDLNETLLAGYGADYSDVVKTMDFKAVLADSRISKVAIATPASLHHPLVRAALLAGKDVFVEKPLCLGEKEAEEVVAIARERNRVLMVGHLLQYHPCVTLLQSMVARGDLGKLYYITSNRLNLGKIRREENALWSFAPHDISVILSLVGQASRIQVACTGAAHITSGVADTTLTTLGFPDGIRAHIYVSWLNPFKEQKLTVVGSRGMAVFDDTRPWSEKLAIYPDYLSRDSLGNPSPVKGSVRFPVVPEAEPLRAECLHFLECCVGRGIPRTDGPEGLQVLRVLQAAQTSLEQSGAPQYLAQS